MPPLFLPVPSRLSQRQGRFKPFGVSEGMTECRSCVAQSVHIGVLRCDRFKDLGSDRADPVPNMSCDHFLEVCDRLRGRIARPGGLSYPLIMLCMLTARAMALNVTVCVPPVDFPKRAYPIKPMAKCAKILHPLVRFPYNGLFSSTA